MEKHKHFASMAEKRRLEHHKQLTQSQATEALHYIMGYKQTLHHETDTQLFKNLFEVMPAQVKIGEMKASDWYSDHFAAKSETEVKQWILEHAQEGVRL